MYDVSDLSPANTGMGLTQSPNNTNNNDVHNLLKGCTLGLQKWIITISYFRRP